MNINATLLIQIINFCIVYCLLRRFLFRPTITVIDHDAAERASLIAMVDQQKKSVEIQEKERERYVLMGREYFQQHRPKVDRKKIIFAHMIAEQESPVAVLLDKDHATMVADIYAKLEEKIKHVH